MTSLEIQKHVDSTLARIGLEKVSHGFVMHRQFAEDLFTMGLQFDKKFFKFNLVEEIAGSDRPRGVELAFPREGESREDDLAEIVLNAFLDAHGIGDGVGVVVVGCDRIKL